MLTSPIADFFIRIKNAYLAQKKEVEIPHSKIKESLARLLLKEGFLEKVEIMSLDKVKKLLRLKLLYKNKEPSLSEVIIVSKPGRRVYVPKNNLPKVLGGMGIAIISTSKGILTDKEAREKGLGGEVICQIW